MEDEAQYILAVKDDCVAMVLSQINSIGGTLIKSNDSHLGDKIKIVCKIKPSREKEFVEWLQENEIAYQL